MNRRSLGNPSESEPPGALHATRRATGGARRESADRVTLEREGAELCGWALNVSRGGIRVILEDKVELGQTFAIKLGTEDAQAPSRPGRVVWVQEEPDGMIVGLEYADAAPEGTSSAPPKPRA